MRNLKYLSNYLVVVVLYTLFLANNNTFAQDDDWQLELYLHNWSSYGVNVKIYPFSMVIDGHGEYWLMAKLPLLPPSTNSCKRFDYIGGTHITEACTLKVDIDLWYNPEKMDKLIRCFIV
jgi:hypothetical protein